jgi:dynein heavy chain
MEKFYWINKAVKPKKVLLEEANAKLTAMNNELENSRGKLVEIENNIRALTEEYETEERKKEELAQKLSESKQKLTRAKNLIDGLGSEKDLWENNIRELGEQNITILGDILLSAAFTVYMGPLTSIYRGTLLALWVKEVDREGIAHTDDYSLNRIMGDPIKIREWNLATLPTDSLSIENGIISTLTDSFPLLVDPQGQVIKWLLNIEQKNNIQIVDINSPNFLRTLENTVQFGSPLLVEGIKEEIDPILFPLLSKQKFNIEGQVVIYIGDKTVPFNPNFRPYLTTQLSNPDLPPRNVCQDQSHQLHRHSGRARGAVPGHRGEERANRPREPARGAHGEHRGAEEDGARPGRADPADALQR